MPTPYITLAAIIEAIGGADFPAVAARALGEVAGFDLAAVMLHRRDAPARVLFDNFDRTGCRQGLATYCQVTHAVNPMLNGTRPRAVRAKDYASPSRTLPERLRSYVDSAPDEELGFRTLGWPPGLEEVGLYFAAWGGLIEIGLYRERGRAALSDAAFENLQALSAPVAAAFGRQAALYRSADRWRDLLAPREVAVAQLLLQGCSTEAVELRLGLSRHTVKDYRKRIYAKLGICSLAELFSRADAPPPGG